MSLVASDSHASRPDSEATRVTEDPSVRVFVSDLAQAERAAQVLMRAGFHVAGNAEASEAGLVAVDSARSMPALHQSHGAPGHAEVARADLAVRVTRAVECLDDPTTSLMANLDALQADLMDGESTPADAAEVVGDCVVAVRQLLEGIQRLKVVAAPPVLEQKGVTVLDLVLRDAVVHHHARCSVEVEVPPIRGIRVRGDRIALGQAIADVLEVFAARRRAAGTGSIRITTARGGDGVRVFVCDAGPALDARIADLLSGGTRARSLDGLALLAAAELVRGVGGRMRVADVPGRACVELTLPMVEDQL